MRISSRYLPEPAENTDVITTEGFLYTVNFVFYTFSACFAQFSICMCARMCKGRGHRGEKKRGEERIKFTNFYTGSPVVYTKISFFFTAAYNKFNQHTYFRIHVRLIICFHVEKVLKITLIKLTNLARKKFEEKRRQTTTITYKQNGPQMYVIGTIFVNNLARNNNCYRATMTVFTAICIQMCVKNYTPAQFPLLCVYMRGGGRKGRDKEVSDEGFGLNHSF